MKKLLLILVLPFLVLSCNSQTKNDSKNTKPIEIGFYETYTLQEVSPIIVKINSWIIENDSILKKHGLKPVDLSRIIQPGYGAIIGSIVPGQEYNLGGILQLEEIKPLLPTDLRFIFSMKQNTSISNQPRFELYAIKIPEEGKSKIRGEHIKEAMQSLDPNTGGMIINLTMTDDGQVLWYEMTSANINKCIAIVADDKLLSCPNVINVIDGGTTQISGNFSKLEAKLIVDGINAGR